MKSSEIGVGSGKRLAHVLRDMHHSSSTARLRTPVGAPQLWVPMSQGHSRSVPNPVPLGMGEAG